MVVFDVASKCVGSTKDTGDGDGDELKSSTPFECNVVLRPTTSETVTLATYSRLPWKGARGKTASPDGGTCPDGDAPPGKGLRLAHGDRVVLGPCRLVSLFLTQPLTAAERRSWTYAMAFGEVSF